MNKVNIYNTNNTIVAQLIQDTLKNNGIIADLRQHGIGEYLNIFMGFSSYGIDILVYEEDKENAKKIIKEMVLLDNNIKEDKIKVPWFKNKRIVASIILAFFLSGIFISLISFIMSLLS